MITSEEGLNLIKKYEGCRLTAYKCPAGIWTIGYGHTKGVKEGMLISTPTADAYLKEDVKFAEKAVLLYDRYYNWTQNEFDALVSFTFNCGSSNLKNLLKYGQRTRTQIAESLPKYCKAGGVKLNGLVRRRSEELELFIRGSEIDLEETRSEFYPEVPADKVFLTLNEILEIIGADQDFDKSKKAKWEQRKPIALANGYSNYKGTAIQNMQLKTLAINGELRRP